MVLYRKNIDREDGQIGINRMLVYFDISKKINQIEGRLVSSYDFSQTRFSVAEPG